MKKLIDALVAAAYMVIPIVIMVIVAVLLIIPVVVAVVVLALYLIVAGISDATDELADEERARLDEPVVDIDFEEGVASVVDDFVMWDREVTER